MFRHYHVSSDHEVVPLSHLLESHEEKIAPLGCIKERPALVTTGGDEVEVT